MGNTHVKPHPRTKNRKQVHWKAADRPQPPGKPFLAADNELTPDLVTIRWTKPLRDGGSPITGYLVEHRRTGSPHWVRASPFLTQSLELSLSGLEPGWRYQFRVSAQNAVGLSEPSESSEPLTVTLQKYAITAPKFTEELQDTVVLENEKVEFVVHFLGQPVPKICWFKDGFEIFSSRRTRILTENDKSVLTIHQSALSDEGEIKCAATNKAGHASTKAHLTLEAPPSIRLPRQYEDGLLFEIGEVIRLKVSVVGRPTPLVFWTQNGESIQNNDRYEVEYVDKCSILKITDARRSDRGEYQIKAVNKIGEDIASFLVTITDKPSPPGRARVVMTLGRSVTLSWNTPDDDGGCKIGNYIIEYYRLGWNVWLKAATSRQLTTILGDLIEGSEYKFRIKAESPYGVSDPSEESEVVFIPDPKRGITTPHIRSKSQPKDIIDEITGTPVASARRKSKGQPRSHSTTKAEITYQPVFEDFEPPKRPERSKIKSPPKTPEISPPRIRKPVNLVTETIMDRASIARELAYGSPDIKVKKSELDYPKNHISSSNSERSYTSSPVQKEIQNLQVTENKSRSDDEQKIKITNNEAQKMKPPSPKGKNYLSRENSDLGGSSEFMLVLYPDGNEKAQRSRSSDLRLSFDEDAIPPPISLSAPELGVEPPLFENLRQASSSTELLHERAMMRLNEAAANEEAELQKRRRLNQDGQHHLEIPKIQINSKDNQDIVGLERRNSGRRLSTGTVGLKRSLWAQRRYSLRNSKESSDLPENLLENSLYNDGIKREKSTTRQRSISEEMEEQEFEKIRNKMTVQNQSSTEKRSIEVMDEDKWLEDYEESVTEEETESSEDERFQEKESRRRVYSDDEEEETYHPGAMTTATKKPINDEPFEILTKRNKLPDPNFVPKPILKKSDEKTPDVLQPKIDRNPPHKVRSHSPMPKFGQNTVPERQRSSSLIDPVPEVSSIINSQGRRRSSSLIPQLENETSEQDLTNILPSTMNIATPGKNISAVAQLTGLTAASIVISETILKNKDNEEAKVVIDHYGDIVRTYSEKRKKNIPKNLNQSNVWQSSKNDQVQKPAVPDSKPSTSQESLKSDDWGRNYGIQPPQSRKNSLTTESKENPIEETIRSSPIKEPSPVRNLNIQDSIRKERSPSPIRRKRSPTPQRGRTNQKYQRKSSKRSKTPSKSPTRLENWSDRRKSSPSPMKRNVATITTRQRSKSPSPIPLARRRPMLKEIMTQTSVGLEMNSTNSRNAVSTTERARQEELLAKAEIKVRGVFDYITDLAMFIVACWLYLFDNELLAVPVLIIMVYRQLADQVRKRIPKWIMKRFSKKNKKQ